VRPDGATGGKWRIPLGRLRVVCFHIRSFEGGSVTPPTTTTRLGGVTTLQDNNKTKAIENMGINLKDQSKRKQLPTFNLNQ
jgi:hypothetical protein